MFSIIKGKGSCKTPDTTEMAHQAGQRVRELLDSATEEAHHAGDIVIDKVRAKPVQASVIAAGVGLLVGLLLRRR